MTDRASRILEAAGVEAAQRRPAEIIELPLRSTWLANTADRKPEPEPITEPAIPEGAYIFPEWIQWPLRLSKYLGFLCIILVVASVVMSAHRTMALAEVGELTCSDKSSLMWVRDDPGSNVPALNDAVVVRCAKAYRPFG